MAGGRVGDAFLYLIKLLDGRLDIACIRTEIGQSRSRNHDLWRKLLVQEKDAWRIVHVHRDIQSDVVPAHSHSSRGEEFRRPQAHQLDRGIARLGFELEVIYRDQVRIVLCRLVEAEASEERVPIGEAMVHARNEIILVGPLTYRRAEQTHAGDAAPGDVRSRP